MTEAGFPSTRFVVLSSGRAGSNMLCSMLNAHPAIRCQYEVFHPKTIFAIGYAQGETHLGSVTERDRAPGAFIRRIWADHRGHAAVGFKLLSRQGRAAHLHVLLNRSIRKIILFRRNRLATYVSLLRAWETGAFTSQADKNGKYDSTRVHVDLADLRRYTRRNSLYLRLVRAVLALTRQKHLLLCYEELNDEPVKRRLLDYLGVETNPDLIRPSFRRQSSTSLKDRIANVDELAWQIRGTPFEPELAE